MAQHDYVIANGTGAAVRSDLNNGLAAIVSNNSGASAPSTTYAYMLWADTSTNLLKLRNGANSAWITVGDLTAANLGLAALASPTFTGTVTIPTATISTGAGIPLASAASPAIYFTGDTNTGIYSPGADQFAITTGGSGRVFVDSSGRVGLGSSTPQAKLDCTNAGKGGVVSLDSTSYAAGVGGTIDLGGNYRSAGDFQPFVRIAAEKANSTNTDYGYGMGFYVTTNGGSSFGTKALTITSTGLVGIGTTSPGAALEIVGGSANNVNTPAVFIQNDRFLTFKNTTGTWAGAASATTSNNLLIAAVNNLTLATGANADERARIDSSGRLLVGTSTSRGAWYNTGSGEDATLQVEGGGGNAVSLTRNVNSASGAYLNFGKSRGTTNGSNTVVQSGDILGTIDFQGADGSEMVEAALIKAEVDGTPGSNDMPGRLVFSTTADGASSPTERARIDSTGNFSVGKTDSGNVATTGAELGSAGYVVATRSGGEPAFFNRKTNDGVIVSLRQDSVEEGSISVSGTTVSYNGAHLSRWSQLPGGVVREEILRGTVLSNIDEMCAWGAEENEQLNRMKVSDVEGDPNVAGVFQCWDDDDDTYTDDFYCAMTGDFIIRIAEGVTVQRGDLLMSAGDGTAKPQDDDIIRSKTIAKVTSTHISETYADGSYCVPCVLMAC